MCVYVSLTAPHCLYAIGVYDMMYLMVVNVVCFSSFVVILAAHIVNIHVSRSIWDRLKETMVRVCCMTKKMWI